MKVHFFLQQKSLNSQVLMTTAINLMEWLSFKQQRKTLKQFMIKDLVMLFHLKEHNLHVSQMNLQRPVQSTLYANEAIATVR